MGGVGHMAVENWDSVRPGDHMHGAAEMGRVPPLGF